MLVLAVRAPRYEKGLGNSPYRYFRYLKSLLLRYIGTKTRPPFWLLIKVLNLFTDESPLSIVNLVD
jgi:hypothetical protein